MSKPLRVRAHNTNYCCKEALKPTLFKSCLKENDDNVGYLLVGESSNLEVSTAQGDIEEAISSQPIQLGPTVDE